MYKIKAKNRLELFQKYEEIMNSVYETRKEERRQDPNKNMIKSYLIEGHVINKDEFHYSLIKFFRNISKEKISIEVNETEEEKLLELKINNEQFYLDATNNNRFWILHTAGKSADTDNKINGLINNVNKIDKIWFTKNILEKTVSYSNWRGVYLKHDELKEDLKNEDTEFKPKSINLKVDGSTENMVKNFISLIRSNNEFNYSTGISRISLSSESKGKIDRVLDDIRYDGKTSTRGKSFHRHLWLINKIYDSYKEKIMNIENNYALNYTNNLLEGLPINIEFEREDLTVEYLLKTIFSAKNPFNLWEKKKKISDDFYKVLAVDLHSGNKGNKINFEISPNYMTVYLPKGNCGNTIARLVCNLQLHIDSLIKVWGGENNELF